MQNEKHYNTLNKYLREKFGEKVLKICIDGGFTCPNRDGTCGYGGCIFCGERGAGEHIQSGVSIAEQVNDYLKKRKKPGKYIAYFQNFTNTYAPTAILRERYDAALCDDQIVALAVGTRPDCINEVNAELLASYSERCYVWAELGLQTANDKTADYINRGYHKEAFTEAVEILNKHGIDVVVHLILGLPGEGMDEVKDTVRFINQHKIKGIKIHSLYVMEGTVLADLYRKGEFMPVSMDEYVEMAVYVITHIDPNLIVHRLTGDCPQDALVAPDWNRSKQKIIEQIDQRLLENDLFQGCKHL